MSASSIDSTHEDSFVIPKPNLQQLASIQVVLPIWHEYFSQNKKISYSYNGIGRFHSYTTDLRKLVESLNTPKPIEKILVKSVHKVLKALDNWIKHFGSHEFSSISLKIPRISNLNPDWCVWLPNGELDYKKTADRMLSSCELSEGQKFAIMCAYCMEDKIKTFDLSSLPEYSIEKMSLNRDFLIAYWIFYSKNKLHEISATVSGSLDVAMALRCDNEPAFEYFWNRLSAEDQLSVAKSRLSCSNEEISYYRQDRLFSMMSWSQQLRLLSEMPDQIIMNFWLLVKSPPLILWAWNHSKNGMTVKQFARVVRKIFPERIGYDDEMQLFIDLWDTAPERLKIYATTNLVDVIVKPSLYGKLLCITDYVDSCDEDHSWEEAAMKFLFKETALKFLHKFLLQINENDRRQLMFKNAEGFGVNVRDPRMLEGLICSCLPNIHDRSGYKLISMNQNGMKKHCAELLSRGDFENFKLKIEFYSPNEKTTREFAKKLLESNLINKGLFTSNFNSWKKMSDFIDETFLDDPSLALKKKKEFISTATAFPKRDAEWNDEEKLTEMMKIAEHVLPPNELKSMKQRFLKAYKTKLSRRDFTWSYFNGSCFSKLVTWCKGDGAALVKFKKSFSLDGIFDAIFHELNHTYNEDSEFYDSSLYKFDEFLKWYFPSAEEAKAYKLRRLETLDFEELNMFEYFLEFDEGDDNLESLLSWFHEVKSVPSDMLEQFKARIQKALGK